MPDEHDDERDAKRVQSRAESLTADESDAGSDDPGAQASARPADDSRCPSSPDIVTPALHPTTNPTEA